MVRKIKISIICFILSFAALMLCACTENEENKTTDEKSFAAAVNHISCFFTKDDTPMASAGDGYAIAMKSKFDEKKEKYITDIEKLDLYANNIIFKNSIEANCDKIFYTKTVTYLRDASENIFHKFDSRLGYTGTLKVNNLSGAFSAKGDIYYFIENGVLCSMDTKSEKISSVKLEKNIPLISIEHIEPESSLILAKCNMAGGAATVVIAPDTGALKYLRNDENIISLDRIGYLAERLAEEIPESEISDEAEQSETETIGEPDEIPEKKVFSSGKFGDRDIELYSPDDEYEYIGIQGSEIFLGSFDNGAGEYASALLKFKDGKVYKSELKNIGLNCALDNIFAADANAIAAFTSGEAEKRLIVIDISKLEFNEIGKTEKKNISSLVDKELIKADSEMKEIPDISDKMRSARKLADDIEQKYGISIILSNQAEKFANAFQYPFKTTNYTYTFESEINRATHSLEELDFALSLYPENYFRQFASRAGTGGVRIIFSGKIENPDYAITSFSEQSDEWYYMIYDISKQMTYAQYHHEIWHITELKITYLNPKAFDLGLWNVFNPQGFQYGTDNYIEGKNRNYTYFSERTNANEISFIDTFGMISPSEDRARIFEAIMDTESYKSADIISYINIKKKFDIMQNAINVSFDTSEWKDDGNDNGDSNLFWARLNSAG